MSDKCITAHGSRLTAELISKFPLYKNDGKPKVTLTKYQEKSIKEFLSKISSGIYHFQDNPCMCGSHDDIVVTEKDRYGIPLNYVLCTHCGLIRLAQTLDDESTSLFYRDDYSSIYRDSDTPTEQFFISQTNGRGQYFHQITEKFIGLQKIKTIFEAGCGAGGNLYAFHNDNIKLSGCDFGEKYLQYGISKGLSLYSGEPEITKTPPNSQDLIILSHVLEHLNHPVEYVNNLIEMITPEGYLLIQVPGMLDVKNQYGSPSRYFQNAHVWNFYGDYLKVFFMKLGLNVIYGDEVCTFLLQKPSSWKKKENIVVYSDELSDNIEKIAEYLVDCEKHPSLRYRLIRLTEITHTKRIIKRLLHR